MRRRQGMEQGRRTGRRTSGKNTARPAVNLDDRRGVLGQLDTVDRRVVLARSVYSLVEATCSKADVATVSALRGMRALDLVCREARASQQFVADIRPDNIVIRHTAHCLLRHLLRLRRDQTMLADISIVNPTV